MTSTKLLIVCAAIVCFGHIVQAWGNLRYGFPTYPYTHNSVPGYALSYYYPQYYDGNFFGRNFRYPGIARHPFGAESYFGDTIHGIGKRSADFGQNAYSGRPLQYYHQKPLAVSSQHVAVHTPYNHHEYSILQRHRRDASFSNTYYRAPSYYKQPFNYEGYHGTGYLNYRPTYYNSRH